MPDITLCTNTDCPVRDKCFRYTAEPSEFMQSYSMFYPINDDLGNFQTCNFFIKASKLEGDSACPEYF